MAKRAGNYQVTEWDATNYVRRSSPQEAMAEEVLALLQLNGNEHILDIGCGDGRVTARIALRLPAGRILGIDASRQMIDLDWTHQAQNLHFEPIRHFAASAPLSNLTDARNFAWSQTENAKASNCLGRDP